MKKARILIFLCLGFIISAQAENFEIHLITPETVEENPEDEPEELQVLKELPPITPWIYATDLQKKILEEFLKTTPQEERKK